MTILTESMELREMLEEASTVEEMEKLKEAVFERIVDVEMELMAALGDPKQIDTSVRAAQRLRFLEKVTEEVRESIRNFGDDDVD
jgi:hypothetical protein